MSRIHQNHCKGIALIEILVSLVLLGIGLAGVLQANFKLVEDLAENRQEAQANYLIRDHLITLQAAGYEALNARIHTLGSSANISAVSLFPRFTPVKENSDFEWNANLKRESAGNSQRIRLDVRVKWQNRGEEQTRKGVGYVFAP